MYAKCNKPGSEVFGIVKQVLYNNLECNIIVNITFYKNGTQITKNGIDSSSIASVLRAEKYYKTLEFWDKSAWK